MKSSRGKPPHDLLHRLISFVTQFKYTREADTDKLQQFSKMGNGEIGHYDFKSCRFIRSLHLSFN